MAVSKSKSKIMRDHEMQLALVKMFEGDGGYDKMLLLGVAGGSVIVLLQKMIEEMAKAVSGEKPGPKPPTEWSPTTAETVAWSWLMGPFNPALAKNLTDAMTGTADAGTADAGTGRFNTLLTMGSGGFSAFCGMLLTIRAFNPEGGGGILGGLV